MPRTNNFLNLNISKNWNLNYYPYFPLKIERDFAQIFSHKVSSTPGRGVKVGGEEIVGGPLGSGAGQGGRGERKNIPTAIATTITTTTK